MDESKYDHLFGSILEEERQLYPFLDAVFGFLSRRTDFFIIQKEGERIGFPPGIAEKIVGSIMMKWKRTTLGKHVMPPPTNDPQQLDFSQCVVSEEVVTTTEEEVLAEKEETATATIKDISKTPKPTSTTSSDTYNGADRGNYRWSQTIGELEVQVPVPAHIKKSKDVDVKLTDKQVMIKAVDECDRSKWNVLVEGDLCYGIQKDETIWSLSPGDFILINCEKQSERWWDGLLVSEPKIDSTKIDSSRPMSDLSEEEQMKIQELMWNQEQKRRSQ
ncbi:nudC domain-containing protein 3 [Nilaparvata lugens]|uniref:nudC domain-containing protein 3 n=1 Tax=Nilaparvata lugens TaxID=108931 RepID=UPI00193EB6CE|nr:nudC domain-containing protein 3 [Nilaparvata lugens]